MAAISTPFNPIIYDLEPTIDDLNADEDLDPNLILIIDDIDPIIDNLDLNQYIVRAHTWKRPNNVYSSARALCFSRHR
jgi:hypothetical protein